MIGTTLAHYHILEEIGRGGMGVVYKARDTKLDRVVAIKCLPARLAKDAHAKNRFVQEARAASSLDDPNICTVFDIGEADDGQLFIVMAFYDGSTLSEVIEKGPLGIEKAAAIARQMAKGLSTAHEAGIVHRDVKPGNVMVTTRGLVKLLDFGVAKLGEGSDLTREGSTVGTAAYMSPEQARGDSVDARSDVWSIGAVLYEMLAGKRAFGGGYEAAVAYSILNEEPVGVADLRSDVPEGLAAIVTKALSKDVSLRYPSAQALADDLAPYSGESAVETTTRAIPAQGSAAPSTQRVGVIFAVVGVAILAVVYGAMMAFGLPDWVFPAAVLLVLVGLPITLYSASVEQRRARLDSGERRNLKGLEAKLSMKLAVRGGILAGSVLVVAVVGYGVLRAAGIGPFGSLITSGALDEQGTIIVTQFVNRTDVENLGSTLSEALRIDLSQSNAVRVMDRATMQSTLRRMEMNPDTVVGAAIGLQIAQREGIKAVIEGEVSSVGAAVQIAARVLSAENGSELVAFRESAPSAGEALDALDRLSARLREEIGESLVSIRGSAPLESVTTRSIDALRHYTRAEEAQSGGRLDEALREAELAVATDSLFGMAYRKAAVLISNSSRALTEEQRKKGDEYLTRAFRLRGHMTELERLLTEATYYSFTRDSEARDPAASIRAYQEILTKWPDDITSLNNLAAVYNQRGRYEEAERLFGRAIELQEGLTWRQNHVSVLLRLGRIPEFEAEVKELERLYPNEERAMQYRASLAYSMDSLDQAYGWLGRMYENARSDDAELTQPDPQSLSAVLAAQARFDEIRTLAASYARSDDFNPLFVAGVSTRDSALKAIDLFMAGAEADAELLYTGDATAFERSQKAIRDFYDPERKYSRSYLNDDGRVRWNILNEAREATRAGKLEVADRLLVRMDSLRSAGHAFINEYLERSYNEERAYVDGRLGRDPAEAARAFEQALDEGTIRNGRDRLGELRELAGDEDGAVQAYRDFVTKPEVNPWFNDQGKVALVQYRLGEVYEARGELDEAIEWYSKMVARLEKGHAMVQPRVEEARRRIDQLLQRKAQEG